MFRTIVQAVGEPIVFFFFVVLGARRMVNLIPRCVNIKAKTTQGVLIVFTTVIQHDLVTIIFGCDLTLETKENFFAETYTYLDVCYRAFHCLGGRG